MSILRPAITASLLFAVSPAFAQQPAPVPPPAPAAPPAAAPLPPPPAAAPPVAPAPAPLPEAPPPADALPPPPPPEPLPPPADIAPPAPAAGEEKPAEELPTKLGVGKNGGFFQPSALLQFWGFARRDTSPATTTTFRLRRLELRSKGEILPKLVGYAAMIDVAKLINFASTDVAVEDGEGEEIGTASVLQPSGDTSVLQDFFITFMSDYADVSVGQFKNPVSYEGYNSASKILFPERNIVARKYGDRRDIGLRVEKKIGDYFYYSAGLFNGTGQNRLDDDNEKDVALRLEAYPVKGVTVAAVGYVTVGERDGNVRDRLEADIKYDDNNVIFLAEYIRGRDGGEDARVDSHGLYGVVGYTFLDRIQPLFRAGFIDNVDPDDEKRQVAIEGCVNYYLRGQEARLALSVSNFKVQDADNSTTEGILFAQASF